MTGTVEKAVAEIKRGKPAPVYLLYGDELLTRSGVKALVGAMVPPEQQTFCVETIAEEGDLASLPVRLGTLPLLGGAKVVVVHDSKAFVTKQTAGKVAEKSLDAWRGGDSERALRLFLQAVAAAGRGEDFLDRAARGAVSDAEWDTAFGMARETDGEAWLRDVAGRAVAEGTPIPEAGGAGPAKAYEEVIDRGLPKAASLILTAEVVDQRRALFKKVSTVGCVIDCGVRTGKIGETQMKPDVARRRIREMLETAGRKIPEEAVAAIVDRTGFSLRALESEVEKILLYIGTRPAVTLKDVLDVLSTSRAASIFDLSNALSDRDAAKALRAYRSLASQREPVQAILGMLASGIRTLILARWVLDHRLEGRFDPAQSFSAFQARVHPGLSKPVDGDDGTASTLAAMHPFRAYTLLKSASQFSLSELTGALEAIREADLALKTASPPEALLIERLLITICAGV